TTQGVSAGGGTRASAAPAIAASHIAAKAAAAANPAHLLQPLSELRTLFTPASLSSSLHAFLFTFNPQMRARFS
ncbi:MAG TPA: hypothetical protein VMY69_07360, partial [Phycisphaerae bacterium]|nr:hypothetical protein [Phycisphaerae bacterium]